MDFTQVILEVMQYTHAEDVKNILFTNGGLYKETEITRNKLKNKEHKRLWKFYHDECIYREWYPNGKLMIKYHYILLDNHGGSYMHGLYQEWHKNGNLAIQQRYACGNLIGRSRKWNEKGKLINETFY